MQLYWFFLCSLWYLRLLLFFNQNSDCIAYKSVAYKRHVMLFWRNNFLLWVFFVCLYCISFGPYFQINIFKSGGFGKYIKGAMTIRGLYLEEESSELL